jgi:hypothetical protein
METKSRLPDLFSLAFEAELQVIMLEKAISWIKSEGNDNPEILKLFQDAINEAKV